MSLYSKPLSCVVDLLVSEFPSNLVWKYGLGKMGLSCRLQAAGQWRGRVHSHKRTALLGIHLVAGLGSQKTSRLGLEMGVSNHQSEYPGFKVPCFTAVVFDSGNL